MVFNKKILDKSGILCYMDRLDRLDMKIFGDMWFGKMITKLIKYALLPIYHIQTSLIEKSYQQ